jgi:hypothetical protein
MSRTADALQLVNRLVERTSNGTLNWVRGIGTNEYVVHSGEYKFLLAKDILGSGFRLQIFGNNGQIVEELRSDQNPFTDDGLNMGPIRPRLQALWSAVTGSSDELKRILKSI